MSQRASRGRGSYHAGLSAEAVVARAYAASGAEILAERLRTPEGEIDLVVKIGTVLVFVEVKQRKNFADHSNIVSERQWRRLECAALHYMMGLQNETGVQPICRFDVALLSRDGAVQIVENARSFDA